MTNSNNDIEELEELLTELEGQEAQLVTPYAEDDDAVTQQMDAPLGDQEWMVQVTALDRRMMSTAQLLSELQVGKVSNKTLVWRGGMDDWQPIARVDELSQAALRPLSPPPRLALGKSLPAPPPSQPGWSSRASSSLPPPPAPLSPSMLASGPSAPIGLPKPVSMPLPPPPAVSHSAQSSNTTRPVAVDFSDVTPEVPAPMQGKRAVMALSAMAILAVFVTVYAVSGSKPNAEGSAAAPPRAISALQPASADKKGEQSPPASAANSKPQPATTAAPAAARPSTDDTASASASTTRQANAPARYSPRSDYRRRTKATGSAEQSPSGDEERSAAASPPPAPPSSAADDANEPSSEVTAAAADDDADSNEAPKSTGKPGSTFNREAAKAALDQAAMQAKNCRPQGGPSGTGRVQVRYEPSGKVGAVSILTSKFENTTTGSCVRMLFRRAKVPEFTGAPVVVVNKSFEIP